MIYSLAYNRFKNNDARVKVEQFFVKPWIIYVLIKYYNLLKINRFDV